MTRASIVGPGMFFPFSGSMFAGVRMLGEMGRLDEVLESVLEREKLWPQDAAQFRGLIGVLRKLPEEVSEGRAELSPQDQRQKDRYLAASAR